MGMLDRLLRWIGRTAATVAFKAASWSRTRARTSMERTKPKGIGDVIFASMLRGAVGIFGYPGGWSGDRIEMVRHYKHWVYVAIHATAQKVSGLAPNVAYVTAGPMKPQQRALRQLRHIKSLKSIQEHEDVDQAPHDHPLNRLFRHPNDYDPAWVLWYELVLFLKLTGNAYLWVVPNKMGLPCELWVIPSHWVWPRSGPTTLVEYYDVIPIVGGGSYRFPADEIIAFKFPSPIHKIDGYSPQTAAAEEIDQYESMQQARFWTFKNGSFPNGAVELDANYADPDDQELDRIYAKFFGRLQGETNTGRPLIIPPGAKYVPLTVSANEMAYVQSVEQVRDIVLAHFGVPKEVAGIQDAGSEIAMWGPLAQMAIHTINPLLQYLGQVLTMQLASRWDTDLRVWWDDTTPPNPTQVNADIECDAKWGAITPNEIRAIRGREDYAHGGDDPLLPMTLSPLPLNTGDDLSDLADLRPIEARETIRTDGADSGDGAPRHEEGDGTEGDTAGHSTTPATPGDVPEIDQTEHRADLLSAVGGINGMLEIVAQLAAGTIGRDTAIQMLVLFFGIKEEEASKLIGDTEERGQQQREQEQQQAAQQEAAAAKPEPTPRVAPEPDKLALAQVEKIQAETELTKAQVVKLAEKTPSAYHLTVIKNEPPPPPAIVQPADPDASAKALGRLADAVGRIADKPVEPARIEFNPTIVTPEAKPDPAIVQALEHVGEMILRAANTTQTVVRDKESGVVTHTETRVSEEDAGS